MLLYTTYIAYTTFNTVLITIFFFVHIEREKKLQLQLFGH